MGWGRIRAAIHARPDPDQSQGRGNTWTATRAGMGFFSALVFFSSLSAHFRGQETRKRHGHRHRMAWNGRAGFWRGGVLQPCPPAAWFVLARAGSWSLSFPAASACHRRGRRSGKKGEGKRSTVETKERASGIPAEPDGHVCVHSGIAEQGYIHTELAFQKPLQSTSGAEKASIRPQLGNRPPLSRC